MGLKPLPFVVASTPRSGTAYTAQLMTRLGVPCVHETHFDRDRQIYYTDKNEGCVSWLSVPFLVNLPRETLILHQVRHPVRTINALIRTHNFRSSIGPNMPFLLKHHSPIGPHPEVNFWYEWHRRIEEHAVFTYRVEDIPIEKILDRMKVESSPSEIRAAVASVPRNHNTYGDVPKYISWDGLPKHIQELARSYGY